MIDEKQTLEEISSRLKEILDSHKSGYPTIRDMASRIEARYRERIVRLIREATK